MDRVHALEDLDPVKREVLRAMVRGVSAADLAWASGRPPEQVRTMAHDALVELDPGLAQAVDPEVRERVADYVLMRQSPGQAAGTWALLEDSREGRRWALWLRESLSGLYENAGPGIPGLDDAPSVGPRARGLGSSNPPSSRRRPEYYSLHERRRERHRAREQVRQETQARQEASPFRTEAISHFREGRASARLPHYASRPLRWGLWTLLGLLAAGLALCASVSVATFRPALAMVIDLPHSFPHGAYGQVMLILLPASSRDTLHRNGTVRVQLPEAPEPVNVPLLYVAPGVLSAHDVATRFALEPYLARQVQGPVGAAIAAMRTPARGGPPRRYLGAVSRKADVRTGSRTLLSVVL